MISGALNTAAKMAPCRKCAACGASAHPASGCEYNKQTIVCGRCVRDAWKWIAGHTKKKTRVGPRGSKKYISFYDHLPKKEELADDDGLRLTEMSARELRKILRREGCIELRQKGSHIQVKCGRCQSTVPVHRGHDIKKGTLGAIERSLEVCLGDDFLDDDD